MAIPETPSFAKNHHPHTAPIPSTMAISVRKESPPPAAPPLPETVSVSSMSPTSEALKRANRGSHVWFLLKKLSFSKREESKILGKNQNKKIVTAAENHITIPPMRGTFVSRSLCK